jgi:hypothetical protein
VQSPLGVPGRLAILAAAFLLTFVHPARAEAQWATLRVAENVRAEPNGTVIAQLYEGTRVRVEGEDGNWSRVTLEGVVWIPSLQARGFGAFDLVVTEPDGENLRDEPRGRIAGRLGEGTLLEEVSREPGWARVRRTAWVWTPSLDLQGAAAPSQPPAPAGTGGEERPAPPSQPAPAVPTETGARPAPPSPAGATGGTAVEEWVRVTPPGPGILTAPDGDTLARSAPGTDVRVLGRDGNWARVRVEGWMWLPGNVEESGEDVGADALLRGVDPGDLAREPERFRGRLVEVDLQFISVERAERIRTDFQEGEPFLLTRGMEAGRGFVYVALPADQVAEAQRLTPLATIRVVGRVRTGAAALTGSPILDLLELQVLR